MAGTGDGSKPTKRKAPARAAKPALLSGGNPQIAKGYGDAPVQAYIDAMGLDRVPHDLVVPHQRRGHRVRMLLPQPRRTLEIGEQEGDRPRRQLDHQPKCPIQATEAPRA